MLADGVVRGSCVCAKVRYSVAGALRPVINCHCGQCRKWSGHYVAATAAAKTLLTIDDPDGVLLWYRTSRDAQRGFCGCCGSSLFWQRDGVDYTSILAGSLDGVTGLSTEAEIYVEYKGDYYDLCNDTIPKYQATGHGIEVSE